MTPPRSDRSRRRAARRDLPRHPPRPGAGAARSKIPRGIQALGYAAVIAAAVLVNLSTLHHEFLTSWDDPTYIVDNPWIRSWSWENLVHVFTKPYFANFLPLHLLSYMVDYSLWGMKSYGFHFDNVVLNALNAVLALLVVRRMFGSFALGFLAALLFAVHPSHVEAVAWVSIRKDLLSTTFLLLAVYFYLGAISGKSLRTGPYIAALVCFVLGLLSKVTIVALPLFLLLLDRIREGGRAPLAWSKALANKVPLLAIGLWLVHLNSLAQVKARTAYAQDPVTYLMVKGHAVWNYLALLTAVPRGRPLYDTPAVSPASVSGWLDLAGLLVLPAVLWIAYRAGSRIIALGAGWIFTLLLPAIGFPLVTYMADRYLYAPSLGFTWMLAAGILWASARMGAMTARAGAAALLTAVPFAGFAYRTIEYNPAWATSKSLWTYGVETSNDFRASNNLAQALANEKRWDEAERLYRQGAQVDNVISYQGLATVYYNTKRYPEAERAIDRAFEIAAVKGADNDEMAGIHYSRGAIYYVTGRRDRAIEDWRAVLRHRPFDATAREWLDIAEGKKAPPK